jgi:hypothetical protein
MSKFYNPPVVPSIGAKTIGSKHKKQARPTTTTQFCKNGKRHWCFKANEGRWFVIVNVPEKGRGKGTSKSWYTMHSVQGVNTAEAVCRYITENILEAENRNKLIDKFMDLIGNDDFDFHTLKSA